MNNPTVQKHIDSLNSILPPPDLRYSIDVAVGVDTTVIYRLKDGAQERVEQRLRELVSHQLPPIVAAAEPVPIAEKQTAKKLFGKKAAAKVAPKEPAPAPKPKSPVPAIAPAVIEACRFFDVPVPPMPTSAGDADSQQLNRP